MFNILPEFKTQYFQQIDLGKQFVKNKNISIVGLARNLSDNLYTNIHYINQLSEFFQEINYFVYENDSTDSTVSILDNLSKTLPNFNYRSDLLNLHHFTHSKPNNLKSKERTTNLALHRNNCLEYVKNNLSHTDFTIVIDLDFKQFSIDGILNSFGWFSQDASDGIVGNSFQRKDNTSLSYTLWNYDCWAYRGNWWNDLQNYSDAYDIDPMAWFGLWQPPIGSQPIKVNSAFGGIGIYKTSDYTNSKYEGYDCEHVCFHKNLLMNNSNYRLSINPSQIMLFN